VVELPGDAVVNEGPNSYTGCVSRPTASESEIAGGAVRCLLEAAAFADLEQTCPSRPPPAPGPDL
jgi:hypothetical protein